MLHTYDKQYSVYASSRYGILENFIIHYYNCYSTYYFVTSAFLYTSVCVDLSWKIKLIQKKREREKNQTRNEQTVQLKNTLCFEKIRTYIYIFFLFFFLGIKDCAFLVLRFFRTTKNRQMSLIKKLDLFFFFSSRQQWNCGTWNAIRKRTIFKRYIIIEE